MFKKLAPLVFINKLTPLVFIKKLAPLIFNKKLAPLVFNKKLAPLVFNKKLAPLVFIKKLAPLVFIKKLAPLVFINEDLKSLTSTLQSLSTDHLSAFTTGRGLLELEPQQKRNVHYENKRTKITLMVNLF